MTPPIRALSTFVLIGLSAACSEQSRPKEVQRAPAGALAPIDMRAREVIALPASSLEQAALASLVAERPALGLSSDDSFVHVRSIEIGRAHV